MGLAEMSRQAPPREPEVVPTLVLPIARKATADLVMVELKANVATSKILTTMRELQPIELAKQRVRRSGSGW